MIVHPYTSKVIESSSSKKEAGDHSGSVKFVDVSIENFEKEVLAASNDKPIIVDFWAPWCGPCKQLFSLLEKVKSTYGKSWTLAKVNVDEQPHLAAQFRVQSIPMLVAVVKGRPVDVLMGNVQESQLTNFLDKAFEAYPSSKNKGKDLLDEAKTFFINEDYAKASVLFTQALSEQEVELQKSDMEKLVLSYLFIGQADKAKGFVTLIDGADELQSFIDSYPEGFNPKDLIADWLGKLKFDASIKEKLITLFNILGSEHKLVRDGRKKMSSILFS